MKFLHSKFVVILIVIAMIFTSGSAVFAATPNEQIISAISGSGIPGAASYAGVADSFLRDTGKVLTQAQADQMMGNINNASAIYTAAGDNVTLDVAQKIQAQFEAAMSVAGFTITNISQTSDGGFTFTIYDPASGKSATVTGNKVSGIVSSSASTTTTSTSGGTTMVAKTALDNSLFALTAILALTTIGAGIVVYRKKAIQ
ncbi:MAG: hypothetical protein ACOH15_10660 [Acetobacterium sp.]